MSLAPHVCVVRGVSATVDEGEERVGEFASPVSGGESAVHHLEEADDNDSFVDIMSGISVVGGAESEGWTIADALAHANLSVETLAEGVVVDTSRLPTRESSFFIPHQLLVCWKQYGGHSYFPLASNQRAPLHQEGIMGLLCFSV